MKEQWQSCTIEQLGEIDRGRSKHRPRNDSILFGGDYPFIQTGDVKRANLYITDYSESYNELGLAQSKLWKKGTLCITIAANIAESAILGIDACFPDSVVGFKPFDGIADTVFVKYLMDMFKVYMQQISKGTTQDNLSLDKIKRVKFTIPCYETQRAIADVLSSLDDLIEVNNKRIKLLEQMAENLYKEWFVRFRFPGHETAEFENGIPKGWEQVPLFDVAKVTYGYPFSSEEFCDDETQNAIVRIRDVPNNATQTYTSETCDDKYLIGENAILVGMDGIFHMCLWNGARAYLNHRVVKIESKHESFCNYLLLLAIAPQIKFWESAIAGTTVAHLGDKHLKKMRVLLPDREKRESINPIFCFIMNTKKLLFQQNERLIKQRNLLLPRLMSGKLEA